MWNTIEAIEICKKIEEICPQFGCHVALTGGTLYKNGDRKDIDILFYRIRQVEKIDIEGLFNCLEHSLSIKKQSGFGWCYKALFKNKNIDIFFPENEGGVYIEQNTIIATHEVLNDLFII